MSKTSQVISFRLSDTELQALHGIQQPGESLNQTAQRLLKERLFDTLPTMPSTAASTLSTKDVDSRIAEQLAPMQEQLNAMNEILLAKLIA